MALAVTLLGSTFNTTTGTHTVTATPAVNDLIIIVSANSGNLSGITPTDNNSSGTYSTITSSVKSSSTGLLSFFVRTALVGSNTSTVFTHAVGTSTGGGLAVYKVTGMTAVGLSAIRQWAQTSNQTGSTPTPVFPKAASTHNAIIGAVFNSVNPAAITQRGTPAYTEDVDTGYGTPPTGFESMHINSGETGSSIAWGSSSATAYCCGVIEIGLDQSPTTALNTPSDTASGQSTTPTLNFTGTDADSDTIEYNIQVDSVNTFNSTTNTPTRIQQKSGTNTTFASSVSAASITPAAGNALVVLVEADTVNKNGITVTDTAGNTWTRLSSAVDDSTFDLEIWIALNVSNTATTITAADNGGGVDSLIIVEEWSNVASANAFDVASSAIDNTGTSTALNSGATSTTTESNEAIICGGVVSANAATMTAGTGFSNLTSVNTTFSTLALESKTVSSTGTQTGAITSGTAGSWGCTVICLKSSSTPVVSAVSSTDAGFTAGHPFSSGVAINYTVQSALSNNATYYWRGKGIDPTGNNAYGAWSSIFSFSTGTAAAASATIGYLSLLGVGI